MVKVLNKTKSLIIGASGLVGNALLEYAKELNQDAVGTYLDFHREGLSKLNYENKDEVNKFLDYYSPSIVWCPAGIVNVDWIEENEAEAYERNVIGLKNLFEILKERKIATAFFSTDYIFDGENGPYSEDAKPNPLNIYGKHKLEAEKMLKELMPENHYIFRTTWVYGYEHRGKNFLYSVINKLSKKETLEVPENMYATATYVKDIAKSAFKITDKNLYGTYNLSNGEMISRLDFAKKIARTFNLDETLIKPFTYSINSKPANRPLKAGLINKKTTEAINMSWSSIESSLSEVKEKLERVGQFPVVENEIKSKICIFIPCYNATSTLPKVFERIPKQIKDKVQEVYVVDNASKDYTYLMAIGYRQEKNKDIKNLKIFKNVDNFGYGGSQKLAYAYAIDQGYDLVVMLHGDAQYAPEKLPVMIEKMEKDTSIDLLFGSRMTGDPMAGGMPLHRFLGNVILTKFQNMLLGTKISEFHSGYRIFRTKALKEIPFHLCDSYYHFDTEIIIQFINKKLKIDEVTINTHYGDEKCYVNIWKYALNVAIVTSCYFLYKLGLRNIPKYKLYDTSLKADTKKIFEEFKTEVY